MTYTGKCSCGAVCVAVSGEPAAVRQCWCRQCQQLAGGGATNNAMFHTADVTVSGPLASAQWLAGSGNTLTHWRCAQCGNPVFAQSSARPQFMTLRLGIFDPGHGLAPLAVIWTDEAPAWATIDPALPAFPRQPPPPTPGAKA
jgi:hypothetical protein